MVLRAKFLPHQQRFFLFSVLQENNLTRKELAERLGVNNRTLSDWFTEKSTLPLDIVRKLTTFTNVTLPESKLVLVSRWKESKRLAAQVAGTSRFKTYGNIGTFEGRSSGGKKSLEIMRQIGIIPHAKTFFIPEYSESLAELVGIILGDGNLNDSQLSISLNSIADSDYIIFVKKLLSDLFPVFVPFHYKRKFENCVRVGINSKNIVLYFRSMGISSGKPMIPKWIYSDVRYIKSCIRGLVDTEGCVGYKVYKSKKGYRVYRQLTFTNRNQVLLNFVTDNLLSLGFNCTRNSKKNIYISNDCEIDKYRQEIGLHNAKLDEKCLIRDYNRFIVAKSSW